MFARKDIFSSIFCILINCFIDKNRALHCGRLPQCGALRKTLKKAPIWIRTAALLARLGSLAAAATRKIGTHSVHVSSRKKDQLTKLVICDITLNALSFPFMFAPPANLTYGEF